MMVLGPSLGTLAGTPLTEHPGIMAGYAYDAGIISLGALSFLNVALDVRAELPFTNEPARFKSSSHHRSGRS